LLNYDFIFKKGILFVRLKGVINKNTSNLFTKEIDPLILDNGIRNVVFNVSELNYIDEDGISAFYKCYLKLKNESDISLCEIPLFLKDKFSFLLKYIREREDEISILTKN